MGAMRRKASAWLNRIKNSFTRKIRSLYNKAVAALRRAWTSIKNAASRAWNSAKSAGLRVWNKLKNAASSAIRAVTSVIRRLLRALPRFRYLRLSKIYIKCLTNPKQCNMADARIPSLTICFSKIGCLGPTASPSFKEIGAYLKRLLTVKLKNWFTSKIRWKTFNLRYPTGIAFRGRNFGLRYPAGLNWASKKIFFVRVRYPNGIYWRHKHFKRINVPSGLKWRGSRLRFPAGFCFNCGDKRL